MAPDIAVGLRGESRDKVVENNIATAYGNEKAPVYATPALVGLFERAAMDAVEKLLPDGSATVGTSMEIKHLAATPLGLGVVAFAEVEVVDGRRLVFRVEAFDDQEKIGEGRHERFIINLPKFLERANGKKA